MSLAFYQRALFARWAPKERICLCRRWWSASALGREGVKEEQLTGPFSVERGSATWEDVDRAKTWTLTEIQKAFTLPLLKEYAARHNLKRGGTKKDLIDRIRASWGQEDLSRLRLELTLSDKERHLLKWAKPTLRALETEYSVVAHVDETRGALALTGSSGGQVEKARQAVLTLLQKKMVKTSITANPILMDWLVISSAGKPVFFERAALPDAFAAHLGQPQEYIVSALDQRELDAITEKWHASTISRQAPPYRKYIVVSGPLSLLDAQFVFLPVAHPSSLDPRVHALLPHQLTLVGGPPLPPNAKETKIKAQALEDEARFMTPLFETRAREDPDIPLPLQLQPGHAPGDVQYLRPLKETLIPVYNHWARLYDLPVLQSATLTPPIDVSLIPDQLEISFSVSLGTMLFHTARVHTGAPMRPLSRLGGVRRLETMLEDVRSAFTTGERVNKRFWRHVHQVVDLTSLPGFSFTMKERRKVIEIDLTPVRQHGDERMETLRATLIQQGDKLVCERLESQTQFRYWVADILQPDRLNDMRMSLRTTTVAEISSALHDFAQKATLSKDGMHLQAPEMVAFALPSSSKETTYRITYEKIVDAACYSIQKGECTLPLELHMSAVSGHQVLEDAYLHSTDVALHLPRSQEKHLAKAAASSIQTFGQVLQQWDDVIALCRVLSLPNLRR